MTRLIFPLVIVLSLVFPPVAWAADPVPSVTKLQADPVPYFVKEGNGFTMAGDVAAADLPTPTPILREEPSGFLMIEHNGQHLWLDPMDVETSMLKKTPGCKEPIGNRQGLNNFASQGIGEKQ